MFEYDFMRTAFAASGVAAILAGTVGFFLVLRGQTFAGHALSHAGFTGATGAVLFGLSPFAGLVGFTFLTGVGMGLFGEKLAQRDVAIGMMLSSVARPWAPLSAFLHLGRDPSRGAAVRQRARRRRFRIAQSRPPRRHKPRCACADRTAPRVRLPAGGARRGARRAVALRVCGVSRHRRGRGRRMRPDRRRAAGLYPDGRPGGGGDESDAPTSSSRSRCRRRSRSQKPGED